MVWCIRGEGVSRGETLGIAVGKVKALNATVSQHDVGNVVG